MLTGTARCEVLIIGGGVTGALLADLLTREGVDVIVIDKRNFGAGSTAASTALLMYEIDASLSELEDRYGWEHAVRCYRSSLHALRALTQTAQGLERSCGLQQRKSLYIASKRSHARALQRECELRRRAGINVDLLTPADIAAVLPFSAPAGLLSHEAAQIDPVRLTHGLLTRARNAGARLFARTCARHVCPDGRKLLVTTADEAAISAQTVIVAAGYETAAFLEKPPGSLHSTYVVCSQPMPTSPPWHERWLIWETSRPYAYLRTTEDNRALIGGADVSFKNEAARDALLPRKTRKLEERFARMFPDLAFKTAFAWTGTFGESDDGLPYIGPVHARPGCLFAIGYGGNGITYGMLAAEILRDTVLGRPHPDAALFGFDR
jgi:glycine/D-amino acid oxidase-like deaminating enzyme